MQLDRHFLWLAAQVTMGVESTLAAQSFALQLFRRWHGWLSSRRWCSWWSRLSTRLGRLATKDIGPRSMTCSIQRILHRW